MRIPAGPPVRRAFPEPIKKPVPMEPPTAIICKWRGFIFCCNMGESLSLASASAGSSLSPAINCPLGRTKAKYQRQETFFFTVSRSFGLPSASWSTLETLGRQPETSPDGLFGWIVQTTLNIVLGDIGFDDDGVDEPGSLFFVKQFIRFVIWHRHDGWSLRSPVERQF